MIHIAVYRLGCMEYWRGTCRNTGNNPSLLSDDKPSGAAFSTLCYATNEVVLEPEGEDNLIQLQVKAVFIS